MKRILLLAIAALALPASAQAQTWTSWGLPSSCSGPVTGTMGSLTVTYTGVYNGVNTAGGTTCYTAGAMNVGSLENSPNYFADQATYGMNGPTNSSFIQLTNMVQLNPEGTAYVPISTGTITFSEAVINPWIALVSVGNYTGDPDAPVTYTFSDPFTVTSYNRYDQPAPVWGSTLESDAAYYDGLQNATSIVGLEFSGMLQFQGTFTSLSFTVNSDENWHGFTVGGTLAEVPEPATASLIGVGLLGLATVARRRRSS